VSQLTAETPQGRIAYREFGQGEPLLFVHGLLVDGRLWDGVAERLAGEFRCIVPDLPMGSHRIAMNPDADLSPPGMARTIVDLMDALGLERATLVGNDSGGAVSQIVTATYPERVERLVLTNCDMLDNFPPFPFSLLPPVARVPGGIHLISLPFRLGPLARSVYGTFTNEPIAPELIASWLEPARRDRGVLRDAGKFTAGAHKRHTLDAAERMRTIPRPVRFAWGTEDRFFKVAIARRLAATLPDARIAEIPDGKTFVPIDQPQRVAELVAEFAREPVAVG
jgi:pimeloyl-ACP methyl ester carboxylesterase